ncbi:hypothetical protein [Haloarcula sp. JP-L23]|uniref:hypothetical protein n=1 Tax=Haloarcula sp. JP-L23 TaxID=2716717 RepID=UPI00140EC31C|nr:hypothetical protein G9465_12020 [Haloarcula sp. JP-L23]
MTTVLNGLLGGLVVGLVATTATAAASNQGLADAIGVPRWVVLSAEVVYGAVAGGALVALELYVFGVLGVPPSAVDVLGLTLGWSVTLLLATLAGVTVLAGRGVGRSAAVPLAVYHLVYALGLWVWVRATWIT